MTRLLKPRFQLPELFRALGVKGDEVELRSASDDFNGHCLALTLLGSYLTDAYNGDIHCRKDYQNALLTTYDREPMPER